MRDPENEGGDSRQRGDATRVVWIGPRSRDDDRESRFAKPKKKKSSFLSEMFEFGGE